MRNDIFLKKGEVFRCWKCNKIVVTALKDIPYEITILRLANMATLHTSTTDKRATILDNVSKCSYCYSLVYKNITYRKYGLEDALFEL